MNSHTCSCVLTAPQRIRQTGESTRAVSDGLAGEVTFQLGGRNSQLYKPGIPRGGKSWFKASGQE